MRQAVGRWIVLIDWLCFFRLSLACNPISPTQAGIREESFAMANHVSSLKRARQTVVKTAVNRANKSKLRGILRTLREAIAKGDAKIVTEQYRATVSILDKSVQKGVLHKNTASRYKSRLNARVKAVVVKKAA
jgi:small subunit ribosomal protein S20